METETSGEYEVEPQNELLGTELYQSESSHINTVEDEMKRKLFEWAVYVFGYH